MVLHCPDFGTGSFRDLQDRVLALFLTNKRRRFKSREQRVVPEKSDILDLFLVLKKEDEAKRLYGEEGVDEYSCSSDEQELISDLDEE